MAFINGNHIADTVLTLSQMVSELTELELSDDNNGKVFLGKLATGGYMTKNEGNIYYIGSDQHEHYISVCKGTTIYNKTIITPVSSDMYETIILTIPDVIYANGNIDKVTPSTISSVSINRYSEDVLKTDIIKTDGDTHNHLFLNDLGEYELPVCTYNKVIDVTTTEAVSAINQTVDISGNPIDLIRAKILISVPEWTFSSGMNVDVYLHSNRTIDGIEYNCYDTFASGARQPFVNGKNTVIFMNVDCKPFITWQSDGISDQMQYNNEGYINNYFTHDSGINVNFNNIDCIKVSADNGNLFPIGTKIEVWGY